MVCLEEICMKDKLFGTIVILAVVAILINISSNSLSYDATNVTTRVNITQSQPVILNVTVNGGNAIDLTEGSTTEVQCNITVRDYNGFADIQLVNATFYHNLTSSYNDADDNNYHYTNSSCTTNTSTDAYTAIHTCSFQTEYYANNGTWGCYATVQDNQPYTVNDTGYGTINALYAINVTSLIDYGNMAVGDTSTTSETANITNFGNMNLSITVYGYGGNNFTSGNGLAFICDVGNISVDNQRYNITDQAWSNMIQLTNESATIPGLTVVQQTNDSQQVINNTYWRLYVPPNPFGQCNGTVVLEAQAP